MIGERIPGARTPAIDLPVSRATVFSALMAIAFANGIVPNVAAAIPVEGVLSAVMRTFDVSVFVWLAFAAGLVLVTRSADERCDRLDGVVLCCAALAIVLPVPDLSWLALSGVALYLMMRAAPGSSMRRGAAILFAATVPMFWARIVLSALNAKILALDATLTAWAVNSKADGNVVPFADGSGALFIAPGCSSFSNLSLALLAFITLVNITSGRWTRMTVLLGALTCALVVAINVSRISLIGYFPHFYEMIHGPVGAGIAGWITTLLIMGLGWLAVRRDAINFG